MTEHNWKTTRQMVLGILMLTLLLSLSITANAQSPTPYCTLLACSGGLCIGTPCTCGGDPPGTTYNNCGACSITPTLTITPTPTPTVSPTPTVTNTPTPTPSTPASSAPQSSGGTSSASGSIPECPTGNPCESPKKCCWSIDGSTGACLDEDQLCCPTQSSYMTGAKPGQCCGNSGTPKTINYRIGETDVCCPYETGQTNGPSGGTCCSNTGSPIVNSIYYNPTTQYCCQSDNSSEVGLQPGDCCENTWSPKTVSIGYNTATEKCCKAGKQAEIGALVGNAGCCYSGDGEKTKYKPDGSTCCEAPLKVDVCVAGDTCCNSGGVCCNSAAGYSCMYCPSSLGACSYHEVCSKDADCGSGWCGNTWFSDSSIYGVACGSLCHQVSVTRSCAAMVPMKVPCSLVAPGVGSATECCDASCIPPSCKCTGCPAGQQCGGVCTWDDGSGKCAGGVTPIASCHEGCGGVPTV
jgi:hypothetical protein